MRKKLSMGILAVWGLVSCQQSDAVFRDATASFHEEVATLSEDQALHAFSIIFSKALSDSQELKQLLKDEALKRFDRNTDVLYHKIKNVRLPQEGKTVRKLLLSHSHITLEDFTSIERAYPLLNIFVSDLKVISSSWGLDSWSVTEELAVSYSTARNQHQEPLFVAGDSVASVSAGEVPLIQTFVLGTNKRVRVASQSRSASGLDEFSYEFVDPAFDGSRDSEARAVHPDQKKSAIVDEKDLEPDWVDINSVDPNLINAWRQASVDDFTDQRAIVYYGNGNTTAQLNRAYAEHLVRFQIAPAALYSIADDSGVLGVGADPKVKDNASIVRRNARENITIEEVVRHLWTKGSFSFVFVVTTPRLLGDEQTTRVVIPVLPHQLLRMNARLNSKGRRLWKPQRYTYTINPRDFQARWVAPVRPIQLAPAWELSAQKDYKIIRVYEQDIKMRKEFGRIEEKKVSLGLDKVTYTEERKSYLEQNDALGQTNLYFPSSVIYKVENKQVYYNTVSTGDLTMQIIPQRIGER